MQEATDGSSSSYPPQAQRSDSKSNILEQVDAYAEEDIILLMLLMKYLCVVGSLTKELKLIEWTD